jgi:ribulose-5-phosphate 4-epimerase/fuculose-1-phosphate aldolase
MESLSQKTERAIWVGKTLFDRGKTSGASANMSFLHKDRVYITCTGSCFGDLTKKTFSKIDINGRHLGGPSPSKELPLHCCLYRKNPQIGAVIHTHSFYSVLWSCLKHDDPDDLIPRYTPYLQMRLGTVGFIPYARPGSSELFELFEKFVDKSDGYLLANHGPVVGGANILSAFFALEELEESLRIAWTLRKENANIIVKE